MYFNFYYLFLFLRKYIKQKNMRLLLNFIIFIFGGFYTFGDNNCCEQCCEYLENCCKKEEKKEENKEEEEKELEKFYLKKTKVANPEEIKKLVSTDWYNNKGEEASFILYEKIDDAGNQNINKKDVIKIKKDKNGFSIDENFIPEKDNTKKWALFEIIYKEEKGEEGKTVYLYCSDIESGQYYGIFDRCKQHISISVIACNTSNVINMKSMFFGCFFLQELDLSNFNTDKATDMGSMFGHCEVLTKIIFGDKFNTNNVTNMGAMFNYCKSLTKLDLSKFNTEKVTDMGGMFNSCASLQQLNLTNFNTDKATKIGNMFNSCTSLQTVTFNKNLNKNIIEPLNELGFTEEGKEEGNIITLKKKQQI